MIRIFDGEVKKGDTVLMMAAKQEFEVTEVGVFTPAIEPVSSLRAGEVGYIVASIKDVRSVRVGETVTKADNPVTEPLPGYKERNRWCFADCILRRVRITKIYVMHWKTAAQRCVADV